MMLNHNICQTNPIMKNTQIYTQNNNMIKIISLFG